MPVPGGFEQQFEQYRVDATSARQQGQHHDQRRELFLAFITQAFGLNPADISREEFISLVRRHGWIDALFRDLVFEFKRDLDRERADGLRELTDYLGHLRYGSEHVGLLTDGLQFEVYVLDGGELRQTDTIDLASADPEAAFLWLDSYLFSQKGVPPTSADLVRRFGASSPTFQGAARVLGGLLERMANDPAIEVKKRQWRILLTRVYGSDVTSDELFVRHTYLAQLAKVLAYSARNGEDGSPYDEDTLVRIVDGRAFNRRGFANVGEPDFFAWILEPELRPAALKVLSGLAASLVVYDLSQINEDLFKQLYQNLVDPATRHDLGEYYTPDWLAELTLEEIGYRPGQSLLDPSCGSGTFLFSAIRRLAGQGVIGWDLINFALDNVVGMDIHPLATTIARINYYLALLPHVGVPGPSGAHGPLRDGQPMVGLLKVPIYTADALTVTESNAVDEVFVLPVSGDDRFVVPVSAARDPDGLMGLLDYMEVYARDSVADPSKPSLVSGFDLVIAKQFPPAASRRDYDLSRTYWLNNFRLLHSLMAQKRNGIWVYVLKNRSQPIVMGLRKFDVVIGNPPWLSYRFIKDRDYQRDVKKLTFAYGLLEPSEGKLFTQMELSTLFYAFCEDRYLAEGGLMAFVMPRSVLTGAKQHRAFQARGMTRVIDLKGVTPLFNVEACVVVRRAGEASAENVPSVRYGGRLPRHELSLDEARAYLAREEGAFSAVQEVAVQSPHYYERFKQGATLVPRNMVFARPIQLPPPGATAFNPILATDPDVERDAKEPWKGIRLEGHVDPPFWFATLLSKHLVPFGVRQFSLAILPLEIHQDGRLALLTMNDIYATGYKLSHDSWFGPAERKWDALKKETTDATLWEWLNYQNKLVSQRARGIIKVVYNASGTHISATVLDLREGSPRAYMYPTQGFASDYTTYGYETAPADEAHYLCAALNAPCVDDAIKQYQPRGLFGERHISRRPFEVCAIPPFDPADADHLALARLSQEAHAAVAALDLSGLSTARARAAARQAAAAQIEQIDLIARRILGL